MKIMKRTVKNIYLICTFLYFKGLKLLLNRFSVQGVEKSIEF